MSNPTPRKAALTATALASLYAAIYFYSKPVIQSNEGRRLDAYLDGGGIATICDGLTEINNRPVRMGDMVSNLTCDEEGKNRLRSEIVFMYGATNINLTPIQYAGLISFSYNVGRGNFLGSTLLKKLNQGDIVGACNQLQHWIFVGKMDCRLSRYYSKCGGLPPRREKEKQLCLGHQI